MKVFSQVFLTTIILSSTTWCIQADQVCDDETYCTAVNGGYNTCYQTPENPTASFLTGYCSSGKNGACRSGSYTNMWCSGFNEIMESVNTNTTEQINITTTKNPQFSSQTMSMGPNAPLNGGVTGINGWICSGSGVQLMCPEGEAIIGACGSGAHSDCAEYCVQPAMQGILCAPPPSSIPFGIATPSDATSGALWQGPYKDGQFGSCPNSNQVVCGLCQSGKGK